MRIALVSLCIQTSLSYGVGSVVGKPSRGPGSFLNGLSSMNGESLTARRSAVLPAWRDGATAVLWVLAIVPQAFGFWLVAGDIAGVTAAQRPTLLVASMLTMGLATLAQVVARLPHPALRGARGRLPRRDRRRGRRRARPRRHHRRPADRRSRRRRAGPAALRPAAGARSSRPLAAMVFVLVVTVAVLPATVQRAVASTSGPPPGNGGRLAGVGGRHRLSRWRWDAIRECGRTRCWARWWPAPGSSSPRRRARRDGRRRDRAARAAALGRAGDLRRRRGARSWSRRCSSPSTRSPRSASSPTALGRRACRRRRAARAAGPRRRHRAPAPCWATSWAPSPGSTRVPIVALLGNRRRRALALAAVVIMAPRASCSRS